MTDVHTTVSQNAPTKNIYTIKELVMMETSIFDYHTSLHITEIQQLAFHLPHILIIGTHHCGNTLWDEFKHRGSFQDVLCCHDYAERGVASFSHQIKSKYFGRNIYVYIEGI